MLARVLSLAAGFGSAAAAGLAANNTPTMSQTYLVEFDHGQVDAYIRTNSVSINC